MFADIQPDNASQRQLMSVFEKLGAHGIAMYVVSVGHSLCYYTPRSHCQPAL